MTEKEFFEALAEVPGKWTFNRFGIRQVNWVGFRCHCPLTAVAAYRTGRSFKTHDFDIAARAIGLPVELAWDIVNAADTGEPKKLFEKLLKATRLA